jgi:hypothetical protein
MTIDLYIDHQAVKHTGKGPWYNARLHRPDSEIIACSTEPMFAACRELVARGITGPVRKWRGETLSAEGDIEQFAGLSVEEGDKPPRVRRWRPFAGGRVSSKTAETTSGATTIPKTLPAVLAMTGGGS